MFKYTLNTRLRYDLFERKIGARWYDTQWKKQVDFFNKLGADRRDIFSVLGHLRAFRVYYSPKELHFIPVGGWLIPAEYFDKIILDNSKESA